MLIPTWDYAMGQVRRQAWVLMHERGYTSSRTVILEPCLFVSMKAEPATVNSSTRTWNPLLWNGSQTSCRRAAATICPRPGLQVVTRYTSCTHMDRSPLPYVHVGLPVQLTKVAWWPWPLTLKVVSEARVTLVTSVSILVFLGLSVLDLGPMSATDRQTSDSIIT